MTAIPTAPDYVRLSCRVKSRIKQQAEQAASLLGQSRISRKRRYPKKPNQFWNGMSGSFFPNVILPILWS